MALVIDYKTRSNLNHWSKMEKEAVAVLAQYDKDRAAAPVAAKKTVPLKIGSLRFYARAGLWKNSTGSLEIDLENGVAYSYSWYVLGKRRENGEWVINDYGYSTTTMKHRYELLNLLGALTEKRGPEIEAPKGLQALSKAVSYYESLIKQLKAEIEKPRSKKSANKDRKEKILLYGLKSQLAKDLMKEWGQAAE